MHRGTWKRREREVAAKFGTRRLPVSGRQEDKGGDDCQHPRLFLQVKHGKQNAREWAVFNLAAEVAKKSGKVPVVCLTYPHVSGILVLCRIEDLDRVAKEVVCGSPTGSPS